MKTLTHILLLIIGFIFLLMPVSSYAFTCSSDLSDPSGLDKCFYNLLQHRKNAFEKRLAETYKNKLSVETEANILSYLRSSSVSNVLEELKEIEELLEVRNPHIRRVLITNQTAIPMTCTSASSSSD